ncbi:Protein of unknown function (DUF3011) [Luteimonas cucumeris]|uniref:DUF3011 family protein n=1 Tax=Luteimonas cucumeris TaxID=985012 RepID=A0A562L8C0_9GAMM|nr:DUF3011 domain-containing protein [Luteimonas cucumeris]TWI03714.1 Protein of unknown function (DUF3011) [Luteimonas cucumeris]
MRWLPYCGVLLLLGSFSGPGAARVQHDDLDEYRERIPDDIVRCESDDGRTRQCAADTHGGVKLLRQLSDSACIEGQTWGFSRNGIWVTQGCRADFATGYGGRRGAAYDRGLFRCESADGRWHLCPLKGPGKVDLIRQLSRSACIRDQSWGRDTRGVWVAQGCRGEFRLAGTRRGAGEFDDTQVVRCESKGGREHQCPARIREGVRLSRQLSDSACVRDRSWGWDGEGIWVREGCRAEFEVR